MSTRVLLDQLRNHYLKPGPFPGGIFVEECGINGRNGSRADALFVGFTSASGRLLVGHELKVSRSDWLRELDKVGKADFWADNCHQWIIVAPGPEVVPADELPYGWGLMYPPRANARRMKVVVKATTRDLTPSWQAVRSIMARVDTLRAERDQRIQREALEEARKTAREESSRRAEHSQRITPEQASRLRVLDRIEQLLGTQVDTWAFGDEDKVGADVAAAALRLAGVVNDIKPSGPNYQAQHLREQIKKIDDGLAAYEEARTALLALTGGGDRD